MPGIDGPVDTAPQLHVGHCGTDFSTVLLNFSERFMLQWRLVTVVDFLSFSHS